MNQLDQTNWYMEFKSDEQEHFFFAIICKNWKTKFSFSEFLCIFKVPWAMQTCALEQNFLHFFTLLNAWKNISYANFDCSNFCQMRYPKGTANFDYRVVFQGAMKYGGLAQFLVRKPDFHRKFWTILANNHKGNSVRLTESINFSQDIFISYFVLPGSRQTF